MALKPGQKLKRIKPPLTYDTDVMEIGKTYTFKMYKESSNQENIMLEEIPIRSWDISNFELVSSDGDQSISESKPVNDYICKACSNDRCSKTEKSCWKCGEPIKA